MRRAAAALAAFLLPGLLPAATSVAHAAPVATSTPAATSASVTAATEPPTLLGFAGNPSSSTRNQEAAAFEQQVGRTPALYGLFWTPEDGWPNEWAAAMLDDLHTHGMTAYVELTSKTADGAAALADGRSDGKLDAMVSSLAPWLNGAADRHLLIAPLPEPNLVEHPWSGNPTLFIQAFHRIRAAFTAAGLGSDKVRFVIMVNGVNTKGQDYARYYPGDGAADIIGFNRLNRGNPWLTYADMVTPHVDALRREVSTSKPILVGQTASVASEGSHTRAQWLDGLIGGLSSDPQLVGAVYFNRSASQTGGYEFRVLTNGTVDSAFAQALKRSSDNSRTAWLFDGLDAWVTSRGGTPTARFADAAGSPFLADIDWVADQAITSGCAPDRFCPGASVTRGQMASFLARALDLPAGSGDHFTDDDTSVHEQAIERVYAAGIANGCATDRFCPDRPVNRVQMAIFLAKALDLPPADGNHFSDDDRLPSSYQDAIERVAAAGITSGCSPDHFCPGNDVTRGQLAAFLHRALA